MCGVYDRPYKTCHHKMCFECLDDEEGGCNQVCPYLQALSPHICGTIQSVWGDLKCGDLGKARNTLLLVAMKILNYLRSLPNKRPSAPGDAG
jgi:hypothetical protein